MNQVVVHDSWELDEPYHPQTLDGIRDQLLDESGFRQSIVDRGLKRLDDVTADGDGKWLVAGRPELSDNFPLYTVRLDGGLYSCTCYGHYWGDSRQRRICSHVVGVIVARRLNRVRVRPASRRLQLTPADLKLPAKFVSFRPQQLVAIDRIRNTDKRVILLQGSTGCHRASQGILMYDGTIKKVEEIQMGDQLMGPDWLPRTVLFLIRGQGPMFEVRPVKGQSFVVNSDHMLTLKYTQKKARASTNKRRSDCKDETLIDISVSNYLALSHTQKHLLKLFRTPVDFLKSASLPLDPYFLGLLLGDGSLTQHSVSITTVDEEIRDVFVAEASKHGLSVRKKKISYFATCKRRGGKNPILTSLRELGLNPISSSKRFIPQSYKTASRNERLAVLAGLLDTDGSKGSVGCFDFSSKSETLAKDVAFLARSVGLAAYVRKLKPTPRHIPGKTYRRRYWRVSISGDSSIIPTRLKRQPSRRQKKDVLKTGFDIVPTGTIEPFYGFVLDGDGRYLLDDFTVTHNSGKSLLAAAMQRIFGKRFLYCCINKSLQTQFVDDFAYDLDGKEYAVELKGRANYPTLRYEHLFPRINASMCTGQKETHCRWCCDGKCNPENETDRSGNTVCFARAECPYRVQKAEALHADLAVVNTALFLNEANFVGQFSGWPWMVIDEADRLEGALMDFVQLEITRRWIDRLNLEPPARKTVEEAWIDWAERIALPAVNNELAGLRNQYGVEDMKRERELERMQKKLDFFLKEIQVTKWVFLAEDDRWTFKPVFVSRYADRQLWRHAERFILMSATIISPDEMAHSLGIPRGDIEFIDLPSTFPPERRPIYYLPKANITKKTEAVERPKAIAALDEILDKHPKDKALVHTVSYGYAQQVYRTSRHKQRMLTYDCAQDRESKLEEFKNAPAGAVLVASSMDRGVDLPDDQCRVVVVMKMPYLNLGDKQISTRLHSDKKGGQLWFTVNAIRTLVQMTGRAMRSADDQCSIYILDAQFGRVYRENKFLLSQWWRDALKMPKP